MTTPRPNARHGTDLKIRKSITVDPELVEALAHRFGGLSQAVDKALRVAVALLLERDDDDRLLDGAVGALLDAASKENVTHG